MADTPLQILGRRLHQLLAEGKLFDPPDSNQLSAETKAAFRECSADIDEEEINLMVRSMLGK